MAKGRKRGKQIICLPRPYSDLRMTKKSIKKPARGGQPWSEEDLGCLADQYGLTPNKELAKRLQRSEVAMLGIARRKLHLRATDNFYTASELARTLGFLSSNTIVGWVRNGWLKGSRYYLGGSDYFKEKYRSEGTTRLRYWCFSEGDIIACLRQRPWLVKLRSMERHYFRSIIKEEWTRDPWYTPEQAASILGVATHSVTRYIQRGWLPVDIQKPGGRLAYIIRRSTIKAFLKNDTVAQHRFASKSKANKSRLEKLGFPTRIGMVWNFSCPRCGQEVKIMAPPDMMGPEVREKFMTVYVNGTCFHSASVELTIPVLRV